MAEPVFDPDDLKRVRRMLEGRLSDELWEVSVSRGPERVGHGLDTYIYGFSLAGDGLAPAWERPLILRVFASHQDDKARRETSVQDFLSRAGYPAPRPLLLGGPDDGLGRPFMIMERVPGSPLLDRFKNPLAIPGLLRRMARLHARLHRVPLEDCPLPYERPLVDRGLAELREQVERFELADVRMPLRWLGDFRGMVHDEVPCLLHNDFHPLNVMLSGEGEAFVLDWSDAAVGDRHHDLARTLALFWLAPPLSRSLVERTLLTAVRGYLVRRYVSLYEEELPVDRERLRFWQAYHAARAWAQVAAIRAGYGEEVGANPAGAAHVPPGFPRALERYFRERAR